MFSITRSALILFLSAIILSSCSRKEPDIEKLADIIVSHVPEGMKWIQWSPQKNSPLPDLSTLVSLKLNEKYTAYASEKDIPMDKIEKQNGEWVGYKEGCTFSFHVKIKENTDILISYSYVYGNLGGAYFEMTYKWVEGEWQERRTGPMIIS